MQVELIFKFASFDNKCPLEQKMIREFPKRCMKIEEITINGENRE
jgi:hypothetical protein